MRPEAIAGTMPGEKHKRWHFDFFNQWSSLNPFGKVNWRDFTFIKIQGEYAAYSGRWELDLALLGLQVTVTYIFDHSFNDSMMSMKDQITNELERSTGCKVVDPAGALDRLDESPSAKASVT